ncbi:MAG TPA: rhamnogalacturonan acetylesterase [Phycisphaerae bacterium]|nr:rhamnogalacturonan acetylesterase [Phycisphaerae bacterium]
MKPLSAIAALLATAPLLAAAPPIRAAAPAKPLTRTTFHFSFAQQPPDNATPVFPDTLYSPEKGFGFEPDTNVPGPGIQPMPATQPSLQSTNAAITSNDRFIFSVAVPPGNYTVTLTLGNPDTAAVTTVKAEARRLMLDQIHTQKGEFVKKSFTVNVRSPHITGDGDVKLDPREPGSFTWDDKLSLEFIGTHPSVSALDIQKADHVTTVFLCGDSTVTDQPRDPYGTWGQMLPAFFKPSVSVANYAESGETLKAFKFENRWDKVMSEVRPGDYVFLQFGTNDLNKSGRNAMWPADQPSGDWSKTYSEANTDYKKLLEDYSAQIKAKGATAVIVSPMTKIDMRSGEVNAAGLRDYPQAAVAAAKESNTALIDLNAMSVQLVKALGPTLAPRAYVEGLHSKDYGGYLFARCIVQGIRDDHLPLANDLNDLATPFDPTHPEPLPDAFTLPLEPTPPMRFGMGRGRGGFRGRGAASQPAPVR